MKLNNLTCLSRDLQIGRKSTEFNTSHYKEDWRPKSENNYGICQYRGYRYEYYNFYIQTALKLAMIFTQNYLLETIIYRNPPNNSLPVEENYNYSPHYWHVFAARLAFVVVFEVKWRQKKKQSNNKFF